MRNQHNSTEFLFSTLLCFAPRGPKIWSSSDSHHQKQQTLFGEDQTRGAGTGGAAGAAAPPTFMKGGSAPPTFYHCIGCYNRTMLVYLDPTGGLPSPRPSGGYIGGGAKGPCPPRSPRPNFAIAKVCGIQGWKTWFWNTECQNAPK